MLCNGLEHPYHSFLLIYSLDISNVFFIQIQLKRCHINMETFQTNILTHYVLFLLTCSSLHQTTQTFMYKTHLLFFDNVAFFELARTQNAFSNYIRTFIFLVGWHVFGYRLLQIMQFKTYLHISCCCGILHTYAMIQWIFTILLIFRVVLHICLQSNMFSDILFVFQFFIEIHVCTYYLLKKCFSLTFWLSFVFFLCFLFLT